MIKFIIKIFRWIVILYLSLLLLIIIYTFGFKTIYSYDIAYIKDYSYIKIEDNKLEPDIPKNSYFIIQKTTDVFEGDYIVHKNNKDMLVEKVTGFEEGKVMITNNDGDKLINVSDVEAKVIYKNNTISEILNVCTSVYVIIIFILLIIYIPTITYKRYSA